MWFRTKPADLSIVADAEERIAACAIVRASPMKVFAALADASTWPAWFADMTSTEWTTAEHGGVGSVRIARLKFGSFEERMFAWDPGVRFAFSIDGASVPLVRRAAEDWRLYPMDGGTATRIEWTLLADPSLVARVLKPLLRPLFRRMFLKSARGLDQMLHAKRVASTRTSALAASNA
jgi:hypothetical protein